MKVYLTLGGLIFCLDPERPLHPTSAVKPFYIEETQTPDITVHISWDWVYARRPQTLPVGQDLVQLYYQEADWRCCELDGGDRGALARTWYRPDFSEMTCNINTVTCHVSQDREGQILRMLPMREIFLHFGVLFFHASQIVYQGKGILFTAPSGTGKTTQAKLWQKYRGAEIICNDRTLTHKVNGEWRTYGYPLDGSEPVRSSAVNELGCVVLLRQGQDNHVERLKPGRAVGLLMSQTVIDGWSPSARSAAMDLLLALLEDIPVYLLTCTPDVRAVDVLASKLIEDEVIVNGSGLGPSLE